MSAEACDNDGGKGCADDCTAVIQGWECTGGTPTTPDVCTIVCGDGHWLHWEGEPCDDNNTASSDGCSSTCTSEYGYTVEELSVTIGPTTFNPSEHTIVCGDRLQHASEECDDWNDESGDGCSSTCTIETGYTCPFEEACIPNCGDGDIDAGEQCDDGGNSDNDGCSKTCQIEDGYTCPGNVCSLIPTEEKPVMKLDSHNEWGQ